MSTFMPKVKWNSNVSDSSASCAALFLYHLKEISELFNLWQFSQCPPRSKLRNLQSGSVALQESMLFIEGWDCFSACSTPPTELFSPFLPSDSFSTNQLTERKARMAQVHGIRKRAGQRNHIGSPNHRQGEGNLLLCLELPQLLAYVQYYSSPPIFPTWPSKTVLTTLALSFSFLTISPVTYCFYSSYLLITLINVLRSQWGGMTASPLLVVLVAPMSASLSPGCSISN